MSKVAQPVISPLEVLGILHRHKIQWILPAIVTGVLAGLYAMTKSDTFEASQSLILRNEVGGPSEELGKFRQPSDMKTMLETLLEVAKSKGVLSRALAEVGAPADHLHPEEFPSNEDIASLAGAIQLTAPKGAEFGATEVFYVKIRQSSRERALALVDAVSRQLQVRFQQIRDERAQSMIVEQERAVSLAEADLRDSTDRLAKIERSVGGDLAELRMLLQSASGDSDLRRKSMEIETELRQVELTVQNNADLVELLTSFPQGGDESLALPSRLLEAQPALKRLKDGLVDAQLHTAKLLGGLTEAHPYVKAAREAELELDRQLRDELKLAAKGVQVDLQSARRRSETLENQLADTKARLDRLAGLRAEYGNLVSEAQEREKLLADARAEMSAARASQASAHAASLLSVIDAADAGQRPLGPGVAMIAVAGGFVGLLGGLAWIFLTAGPSRSDRRLEESKLRLPVTGVRPIQPSILGWGERAAGAI